MRALVLLDIPAPEKPAPPGETGPALLYANPFNSDRVPELSEMNQRWL